MTYDALNRIASKNYANDPSGTSGVTYCYDAPPVLNQSCPTTSVVGYKGRLTQVQNANSATLYTAFDGLGRVTSSSQTFGRNAIHFHLRVQSVGQSDLAEVPFGKGGKLRSGWRESNSVGDGNDESNPDELRAERQLRAAGRAGANDTGRQRGAKLLQLANGLTSAWFQIVVWPVAGLDVVPVLPSNGGSRFVSNCCGTSQSN